ncbi:MAG: sortase [Candidatus Saccharibacteria bacterium]|nr:sortase [Candidatus Saccharibacteria bacterium]
MNPTTPSPRPLPDQSRQPLQQPARQSTQDAAANVIREQINSIYNGNSTEATPHTTPVTQPTTTPTQAAPTSTTTRPAAMQTSQPPSMPIAGRTAPSRATEHPATTHGLRTAPPTITTATAAQPQTSTTQPAPQQPQITPADWQHYHSSWQKYYQLYYERYYANHLSAQQAQLMQEAATTTSEEDRQRQAIRDLRAKIRSTVQQSTRKIKKSRHFIPVMAGLTVMLVFTFLQYNRVIFGTVAAYTSPGNINPQNIIVDPTVDIKVGPEPRLIIPKINIDAPIVYGAAADVASQRTAMEKGVAHFSVKGASATPGQYGNTVLAAHSSNDAFASGAYKFIFAQNEKLQKDDIIYVNHEGTRYTYRITKSEVVLPHEVSKIQIGNDKPMLTLISCVPLGTAEKRLLLFAEQISPGPETATRPSQESTAASADIPGKPDPTLLERLFGAR